MTDSNTTILPRAQSALVDSSGRPTREFYYFFQRLVSNIEGQISDLTNLVNSVILISKSLGSPDGSAQQIIDVVNSLKAKVDTSRVVTGAMSLAGGGELDSDLILTLKGDRNAPGEFMFYGTDSNGALGWQPQGIPDYITTDDVPEGEINLYFTDPRVYDASKAQLVAGSNITLTANDGADTITIAASSGGSGVLPVVTGDAPPVFVYLDNGSLVYAEAA